MGEVWTGQNTTHKRSKSSALGVRNVIGYSWGRYEVAGWPVVFVYSCVSVWIAPRWFSCVFFPIPFGKP